eukprot:676665-Pelagomonas_calceolata.AAC.1
MVAPASSASSLTPDSVATKVDAWEDPLESVEDWAVKKRRLNLGLETLLASVSEHARKGEQSCPGEPVDPGSGVGESCKDGKTPLSSSVPPIVHTLGAAKHTEGLTFMFKGVFGGERCSVLFDTGASTCF